MMRLWLQDCTVGTGVRVAVRVCVGVSEGRGVRVMVGVLVGTGVAHPVSTRMVPVMVGWMPAMVWVVARSGEDMVVELVLEEAAALSQRLVSLIELCCTVSRLVQRTIWP